MGQSHERAVAAAGVVEDALVNLLAVNGQVDGLAHQMAFELGLLHVEHQAPIGAGGDGVGHVFAVGALFKVKVLGRRQVGEAAVGHVQTPGLKVGDQRVLGLAGEDGVLDPVNKRTPILEVVRVLVDIVEVANLVLFQNVGAGGGPHLDDVLAEVQGAGVGGIAHGAVGVSVKQVARQHLGVVNGQELDESAGGELEV